MRMASSWPPTEAAVSSWPPTGTAATPPARAHAPVGETVADRLSGGWEGRLEAACASSDTGYADGSDLYDKVIVPRIQSDRTAGIEVFETGAPESPS